MNAERIRLAETERREKHWRRWGPYLSERQWGTVREDYSVNGDAWGHFPFEHSHLRAYRWGEDGLGGISDNHQRFCIAFALWNGRDPILKERLFGLTNAQGNRGEDVKELYYYLDATPTHSYLKFLYKYPQAEYPYTRLIHESRSRSRKDPEFEIWHTGIFDQDRYFDVFWEMAKDDVDDLLFRITAVNRGPDPAPLHILPTLWFRNSWSFSNNRERPMISISGHSHLDIHDKSLGHWSAQFGPGAELLFTENDTNTEALYGRPGHGYYKDAFARYLIRGERGAVKPGRAGTKCAASYSFTIAPGASATVYFRLSRHPHIPELGTPAEAIFRARIQEADDFYCGACSTALRSDALNVQRQAFAGLIWTKQFFHFDIETWTKGDPGQPAPPPGRAAIRNGQWRHFFASDILSMPDKWEYPWFAAWDTAFHMIPFSIIDPDFAKQQLKLFLREWYMAPNGQIPAYEWNFSDVNPPVHAWACWRVFTIERKAKGRGDYAFLEGVFHKLMLNFTWWVNRKDSFDNNIFEGGFLGLDNIGVFDRSKPLVGGAVLEQSDATSWMAMFCLNMLRIATELALQNPVYEDIASKFFEHFLFIAEAMSNRSCGLWDEKDGFYYDMLRLPNAAKLPLKIRSLVGLLPLFAVETLDPEILDRLPGFRKRMEWFIENRPDLTGGLASMTHSGIGERRLLAMCDEHKLRRILSRMLDEDEFLSPFGIRSLSRFHAENPYELVLNGQIHSVRYEPAESETGMFGGNSNWRGPVWFPTNYLLIESLQKFAHYYGDTLQVEFPTRSGRYLSLMEVASELSRRISRIFLKDSSGVRPAMRHHPKLAMDPNFADNLLFFEYFHGDNGIGLGASHQTGWTALVAKLLQQSGD